MCPWGREHEVNSWGNPKPLSACGIAVLAIGLTVAEEGTVELPQPDRVDIAVSGGLELASDYYPPSARTAPGLLLLHGWDWPDRTPSAGLSEYAREFQQAGYAVLVPNMRGWPPTGGRDDCGGSQVADSQKALRWLGERQSVDANRLFIAGYSQGGQVALLAAARGAPVKAVAAFAPVTDLERWGEQTDTPGIRDYLEVECGGPTAWPARSVSAQETSLLPPLLLMHGESDRRVPTSQSLRLYRRLLADRAHVELRLIPGAGHAIDAVLLPQFAIAFFESSAGAVVNLRSLAGGKLDQQHR